jgi:hypothetical protein
MSNNSGKGEGDAPKDDKVAKQPEPTPTTAGPASTGPAPTDTGVPVDTGAVEPADTGAAAEAGADTAAADTDAATGAGELVAETGAEEPEPEPDPEPKVVQPKPQPKPKLPPDQALAEARKASLQGNNTKAYSLAKDAYDQNQNGDALNLMGVAACKMGSASKAKAAHRKMTASDKDKLEKLCASVGVEL